jgi:SAM-dependent methyltransferase
VLGYKYKKYMYFSYLKRKFGSRFKPHDPGAIAPPELIETEALMHADDLKVRKKPEWYFGSGYREAWTVLTTVEQYGAHIEAMRSVLEFGSGSGRVIRHFRHVDGLRLAATDANSKPVEWNRRNLPGIEFNHNALEPPLAYPDGSFDLIYALSVFTHIPLEWQRPWLDELRRVLRPGGYLLCTVHGDSFINTQLSDQERAALNRDGKFTLDARNPRASYSSQVRIHPVRAAVATCGIGAVAPALPGSAISLFDRAFRDNLLQAGLECLPTSSNLSVRSSLLPK